jgi:hypothetical protein
MRGTRILRILGTAGIVLAAFAVAQAQNGLLQVWGAATINGILVTQATAVLPGDYIQMLPNSSGVIIVQGKSISLSPGQTFKYLGASSTTSTTAMTKSELDKEKEREKEREKEKECEQRHRHSPDGDEVADENEDCHHGPPDHDSD